LSSLLAQERALTEDLKTKLTATLAQKKKLEISQHQL